MKKMDAKKRTKLQAKLFDLMIESACSSEFQELWEDVTRQRIADMEDAELLEYIAEYEG